jgi:predicted Zn-dependent peptidase
MKYTKTTLKNGLRVITVPLKNTETVTAMVLVSAGSDYETKEINGLSHFLEHMCFQGTVKRPNTGDVSRELDELGAQSNAFTSKEYTGYWAKAQSKHLPKLIDIVSDIYQNPIFTEDAIQREKGVVIEEMKMYEDLPQAKAGEVFEELMYGDQPAGWPIIGRENIVRNLTQKDLIHYRTKHYVAKGTVVVVAGKINEAKTIKMVDEAFKNISKAKKEKKINVKESQKTPQVKIHYKETDQAHIIIGFRAFPLGHKDNYKVGGLESVLGHGMSSRLFRKMRDELGLCYYVRAGHDASLDRGYFAIASGVAKDRVKEAILAILAECRKMKEELVSDTELKKAKELRTSGLYLGLETSDQYADFYAFPELLGQKIKTAEERVKKIESIKPKDVMQAAKEIFKNEGLNLAIVGPYKDTKEFEEIFKI